MLLRSLLGISLAIYVSVGFSQSKTELLEGKISYVTSNNVYVKFENTENIKIGDTLGKADNDGLKPCLKVINKSSISCVCTVINNCEVKTGDQLFYQNIVPIQSKILKEEIPVAVDRVQDSVKKPEVYIKPFYREDIRGRISLATYSNLSSVYDERHSLMYRFSLNASHIGNSKVSLDIYMNYRQNYIMQEGSSPLNTNFFNVYNLAVKYDVDTSFSITVGRKINNNVSSIGAIDGLQVEKSFGHFYAGAIVGSRPDIYTYGFNSDLFQYGGFIGIRSEAKDIYSQTSLGAIEQNNSGNVDRRYAYIQHSSTLFQKLNLFASSEVDFYNKVNGETSSDSRLTNLFVSAGYRFSRKVRLTVSYDSRRRTLYYETYKTDIEQLMQDDESRQGLRLRLNVNPFKNLTTGVSVGRRFQISGDNQSDNLYGYVGLSNLPFVKGRFVASLNQNTSIYLINQSFSFRYSRPIVKNKLDADFYVRLVDYKYLVGGTRIKQNYYGSSFSYIINRNLVISIFGEMAYRRTEENYRINFRVIKRINKKKK
jgi:hypothetical protein